MRWSRLFAACVVIWVLLAALFAVFDLSISVAVVNRQSIWGQFLAKWGEEPGLIAGTIATALVAAIGIVGLVKLIPRFDGDARLELPRPLRAWAWSTFALLVINRFLFVPLGKLFWGRVRFKDLDAAHADFSPWYVLHGITGHFSFPSGHAAAGWLLLPLVFLTMRAPRAIRYVTLILSVVWGVAVSLSRVRVGAHYASDVLFSTGVATIVFLLCFRHFYPSGINSGDQLVDHS